MDTCKTSAIGVSLEEMVPDSLQAKRKTAPGAQVVRAGAVTARFFVAEAVAFRHIARHFAGIR